MLFTSRFGTHVNRIRELIQLKFNIRESHIQLLQPNTPPINNPPSNTNDDDNEDLESDGEEFNFYPKEADAVEINTELERYNNGVFPMDKKGCVLGWWKVHCKDFPILGSLARDYLACAASSAAVEQTFSAAAQ
ncbi:hypothetical protein PSHT_03020 [Puccinia striiformis]|uniref:HAT C-terminal dimerisation domain-containing protein n=1 Tax=Puccinia striiformis TaxID=27350 RepID=A0A2S4WGV9_9BASI|nr:hypothetical protein PSHT_03020 [Puccinia striiformis]